MVSYRITPQAQSDIISILAHSLADFGEQAALRYEALINAAILAVVKHPTGLGRKPRPELGSDVYQYYLALSRNSIQPPVMRVKKPRHYLVYRLEGENKEIVAIGRILQDTSIPGNYLNADSWK